MNSSLIFVKLKTEQYFIVKIQVLFCPLLQNSILALEPFCIDLKHQWIDADLPVFIFFLSTEYRSLASFKDQFLPNPLPDDIVYITGERYTRFISESSYHV